MSIVGAFIVPHPPIILPGVGKGEENDIQKTIDAYRKVAQCIADFKPETIARIVDGGRREYLEWRGAGLS